MRSTLLINVIIKRVGIVALVVLCGCGSKSVSVPSANPSCSSNIATVGSVAVDPSAGYTFLVSSSWLASDKVKLTITSGTAPFQVATQSWVGLAKDKDSASYFTEDGSPSGVVQTNIVINESDVAPSSTDPSCSTYEFYMQAVGPFSFSLPVEELTVRDAKGNSVTIEINVTIS